MRLVRLIWLALRLRSLSHARWVMDYEQNEGTTGGR
jgi:hypothetical protein